MGPETKPHIWEDTETSGKCMTLFSPWCLLLWSDILWARLLHLLFYNQSNKKKCIFLPLQCSTEIKQKRFKPTTYVLDAPIGNRGIKEKPSFIISLVAHVITLENMPKKLPGWQAIFWKTRHHIYMNMKECVPCMPSSQSSIMLLVWWEMAFQTDQWCHFCVDMHLKTFQPQIVPPHFSIFSTVQKKLMAESLPASGFFVVEHHRLSKMSRVIVLWSNWGMANREIIEPAEGKKNPRKHEAI